MADYLGEVKKIISVQFGVEEETIEEDSFLESDLNLTDLDIEDLISTIEDKYQIKIPQNACENFKTVADLANFLDENEQEI